MKSAEIFLINLIESEKTLAMKILQAMNLIGKAKQQQPEQLNFWVLMLSCVNSSSLVYF